MPATIVGGCGAWETRGETGARDMAVGAVGHRVDASREDIGRRSSGGKEERMSKKITRGGSIECSFKNKGIAKVQKTPSSSANRVGAKIRLRRRSWSRGHHRDLQKKSKPEVGLLRQDPPMLKSVLCLNGNGVLEQKF